MGYPAFNDPFNQAAESTQRQYTSAFALGQARDEAARTNQTRQAAQDAYATGGWSGAANAFATKGDFANAQLAEQEAARRQTAQRTQQLEDAKRLAGVTQDGLRALQGIRGATPEETALRRAQAYTANIAPILKRNGLPDEAITHMGQIAGDDTAIDAEMTALGAKLREMSIDNVGGDLYRTPKDDPNATPQLIVRGHRDPKYENGTLVSPYVEGGPPGAGPASGAGYAQPAPQGAPGTAPAASAPMPAPTGGTYGRIGQIAAQAGAKPAEVGYLQRLAQVESGGQQSATNGRSTGMFQFHPDTFASVGGTNINDEGQQTKAALALSRRDRQVLAQAGVEPTDANTYIMHQQGVGGGRALLTAPPDVGAVAALMPAYGNPRVATAAIAGNIGMRYRTADERRAANAVAANMTAGEFVGLWRGKWSGQRAAAASPAPQASAGFQTPTHIAPKENAPSGYRFKADGSSLEPIPGGPADLSGSGSDNGLTGQEFLKTLPASRARLVQAIADGRAAPQAVTSFKGGERQRLMEDVAQFDPNFDLSRVGARAATRKDFAAGKAAQNVTAINTAIGHLNALDRAASQLNNIDWHAGQTFVNVLKRQTGRPEITQFEATKEALASELTRVFTGAGGSVFDREGWQDKIDAANSPRQLQGVVRSIVDLLGSRIEALGQQYEAGMGRQADPLVLLKPQAAYAYARLSGGGEAAAKEAAAKAGFYKRWDERGKPLDQVDAAWEDYRATKFGQAAAPAGASANRPSLQDIFR